MKPTGVAASRRTRWDFVSDPLLGSGEAQSFYVPLLADPILDGTFFVGLQHVWRIQDSGGTRAYLDLHCNEFTGDFAATCGDWLPIGDDLTGAGFGTDKTGSYVVSIARARVAGSPLWVATRRGRLFVSANAEGNAVHFTRIDTAAQPTRFISGIAVSAQSAARDRVLLGVGGSCRTDGGPEDFYLTARVLTAPYSVSRRECMSPGEGGIVLFARRRPLRDPTPVRHGWQGRAKREQSPPPARKLRGSARASGFARG